MFTTATGEGELASESAHCIRYACLNEDYRPANYFRQGSKVHFFFEFEVLDEVAVAFGGVLLTHDLGYAVYGKSSYQQPADCLMRVPANSRVRFHHAIELNLEPATYSVTFGLATTDLDAYLRYRKGTGSERLHLQELSRVREALRIQVDLPESGNLTHYGLVGLPDETSAHAVMAAPKATRHLAPVSRKAEDSWPTILHVTHWKAGSQWIRRILDQCAPGRTVEPEPGEAQIRHYPVQAGRIYPTVYLNRQAFDLVALPPNTRRFVVIRDLRDTLVSAYFSFKTSHPILTALNREMRSKLQKLDLEEGMLHLCGEFLAQCADIQLSWLESGEPLIRYEDLIEADVEILTETLIGKCGLPIEAGLLREIILANRFETVTGRAPGNEDRAAHERKGIAGDWRNHFTPRVTKAVKARFGGVLVATGYETSLDW